MMFLGIEIGWETKFFLSLFGRGLSGHRMTKVVVVVIVVVAVIVVAAAC